TEGREAGEEADSQAGTSTSAHGQPANVHALRRGVQLLEMLVDAGRHQSWAFVSMTYDELAHLVESQGLHVQLLTWLHENVASTFAALFLCDREELGHQGQGVVLALEDDEPAVLDILRRSKDAADLGLLCSEEQRLPREAPRLRGCLLACLPSLMRLVQACEKALAQGSLADIDALLVCGMHVLPPLSDDDDVANNTDALAHADEDVRLAHTSHMLQWAPTRRRVACSALYVAANWVRELVNAFADQRAPGMRPRVLRRVDQLAHLEACMLALGKSLVGTPLEFHPPAAGLLPEFADSPARAAAGAAAEARGLRIAPQGSVPSDQGAVQTLDIGGLLLSQQDTRTFVDAPLDTTGLAALATAQDTAKRGRKRKSGSVPAPFDDFLRTPHRFLRELSLPAYTGVLVLPDADEPPADAAPQLTVCALDLVLRELLAVVRGKLVRHAEKRTPAAVHKPLGSWATFGSGVQACGAQEFASTLLRLLPALLRHLHRCLAA
ncbi:Fanconi anemia group D2 protein, partial [Coemansia sp. RSA 2703]